MSAVEDDWPRNTQKSDWELAAQSANVMLQKLAENHAKIRLFLRENSADLMMDGFLPLATLHFLMKLLKSRELKSVSGNDDDLGPHRGDPLSASMVRRRWFGVDVDLHPEVTLCCTCWPRSTEVKDLLKTERP